MRVLALDTTTRAGSVALVVDGRVVEETSGDQSRTHAERLPVELLAVADRRGMALADVDLFAVAAGPGSFTGLRIGIATMQGFAFTTGRPLVPVSALDALGTIAGGEVADGSLVAAWIDAHRGEVFAALYRVMPGPFFVPDRLTVVEGPTVGDPRSTLKRWLDSGIQGPVSFLGDGALRYAAAIERSGLSEGQAFAVPMLAGAIGRLAAVKAQRGEAVAPGAVQALYVRRPDAEIERDKTTLHHQGHRGHGGSLQIELLTDAAQIDEVLAIEESSFTNPWTREMYVAELENRGVSYCYLARHESGAVVGFCSFWHVVDEVHINNLAVAPPFRRAGVATALLARVLNEGSKLGAARATLEVRRSNDPALFLYERFGFSLAGVRRAYYAKPTEDAIVLSREGLTGDR